MIPPTVHLGTLSPGEFNVFEKLRDDPSTKDWTVLHSYDLPVHISRKMGEIDFVVMIPSTGILCLSVKHHLDVSRSADGVWRLGQEPPTSQGPFKKARDDMFSLKERVEEEVKCLSFVPYGFCVLFTRAKPKTHIEPVEWREHEQIYSDLYKSRSLASLLFASMQGTRELLDVPRTSQHPNQDDIDQIVKFLRPELEVYISPKDRAALTSAELKLYTDEQTQYLDGAEFNERMIFNGPAGTGKTLLAIEMFRRETDRGKKCCVLCYNRLLRQKLQDELNESERLFTADGLLLHVAGIGHADNPDREFWDNELPDLALSSLLENPHKVRFDCIVIDEAQDVLARKYLDVIELIVNKGLKNGRWIMFGDFDRQSIYLEPLLWHKFAKEHQASAVPLRTNCRNTQIIAKYAEILGGMHPGYKAVRRQGDGVSPTILFYGSDSEQDALLRTTLDSLHGRFEWTDIVVLSAKRDDNSCIRRLPEPWKSRAKPYSSSVSSLRYASIHRFKGLESAAIVVTDIERLGADERSSLLYVATTRAVDRLAILAHRSVQSEILEELTK